ncbi:hypothetical protein PAECIP111893_02101 [Paenibacillus plantiphilus]|uniref:Uncharacterized protein n=1 Tax=Paenibacillus plantiphilus TaxID=2905650 RepID=A0ABN8GC68_9BACL|nr:hypothetical protein PAECIP111893_02101 [Paenibacillus plantiphilus]
MSVRGCLMQQRELAAKCSLQKEAHHANDLD